MKRLTPFFLLLAAPLLADQVTVKEALVLKSDRAMVSIRAGTTVELVARDEDTVTIKYRNVTGKISARKVGDPIETEEAAKPAEAKLLPDDGQDKSRAGSSQQRESAGQTPGLQKQTTAPRAPQTTYGKAVQKAKDNAAAHTKNVVKPADEIMKEKP